MIEIIMIIACVIFAIVGLIAFAVAILIHAGEQASDTREVEHYADCPCDDCVNSEESIM